MSLTPNDVNRIAKLAQLEMDEQHSAAMLDKLNGIFALAEQMRAVNTDDVPPLAHPLAAHMQVALRLRDDVPTEPNRRDDYQKVAPKTEDGLYLVPKVID